MFILLFFSFSQSNTNKSLDELIERVYKENEKEITKYNKAIEDLTNGKDKNQERIKETFLESIKDLEKKQSQLLMLQVLREEEEKLKEEIEQDTIFIANSLLDLEKEIQEVRNLNEGKTYNTNDKDSLEAALSIILRQGAIETKYKKLKLCSCKLALKKASLEKFILFEIEQIKKALYL